MKRSRTVKETVNEALMRLASDAFYKTDGDPLVCTLRNEFRHQKRCGAIKEWITIFGDDTRCAPARRLFRSKWTAANGDRFEYPAP